MDDFQVLRLPSGLKRFTVICITVMLNFVAFLYSGVSPRSDVFTRNNIYSFLIFFPYHFLMVSDSSYYTLEYHRTAGRVRFYCAMMLFIHIIQHSQRLFCSEILYMGWNKRI